MQNGIASLSIFTNSDSEHHYSLSCGEKFLIELEHPSPLSLFEWQLLYVSIDKKYIKFGAYYNEQHSALYRPRVGCNLSANNLHLIISKPLIKQGGLNRHNNWKGRIAHLRLYDAALSNTQNLFSEIESRGTCLTHRGSVSKTQRILKFIFLR